MKKPEDSTQGKHYEVDTRLISPLNRAGGNIRSDYGEKDGSLQELVDSIRENGIKEPLKAFRDPDNKDKWIAINGHTRLKACEILNKEGLAIRAKIIVVDARRLSDEELITDMVVSNAGRPLKAIEMAEAVRRMIGYGHKPKDIAKKWGKTAPQIKNLELLANAPKVLRDMVSDGKISSTLVLTTFKEHQDFNKAMEIIKSAAGIAIKKRAVKEGEMLVDEEFDVEPSIHAKVTKKHIDMASNRVDSMRELQRVLNKNGLTRERKNEDLYTFAKKLAQNELIGSEIETYLFN